MANRTNGTQSMGLAVLAAMAALLTLGVAAAPAAQKSRQVAQSGCDPNYDMACVPIARDVDCAGGNGNGPAYVDGPVRVIGRDIYQLDRDGNGYGCEPRGWTPPA